MYGTKLSTKSINSSLLASSQRRGRREMGVADFLTSLSDRIGGSGDRPPHGNQTDYKRVGRLVRIVN